MCFCINNEYTEKILNHDVLNTHQKLGDIEEKPESSGYRRWAGPFRRRYGNNVCASRRSSRWPGLPSVAVRLFYNDDCVNTNPVITTYHGTVVVEIPITTLLAGHEAEIRAAAAQGLSPTIPVAPTTPRHHTDRECP